MKSGGLQEEEGGIPPWIAYRYQDFPLNVRGKQKVVLESFAS